MALDEKEKELNNEAKLGKNVAMKKPKNLILEQPSVEYENNNEKEELNQTQFQYIEDQEKKTDKNETKSKNVEIQESQISEEQNEEQNSKKQSKEKADSQPQKSSQDESQVDSNLSNDTSDSTFLQVNEHIGLGHQVFKIIENIIFTLISLLAIAFTIFTLTNINNSTIANGVSILGVDVAGLEKTAATDKISSQIKNSLQNDILLKHNDFETNIGPEQLETSFDVESAITAAFELGAGNNIFSNSLKKLTLIVNPIDITPDLSLNTDQLESTLNVISTQLPDAVIQSDYYIDGNNLIVTSGKEGVVIDITAMSKEITVNLNNLSYINNPLEIATIVKSPDNIDIENIYKEIHKEAVDARYDAETHIVYPEENGLDFDISLDEAKAKIVEISEECTIPLKVLRPNVTTNMIGMEAFPSLLSSFSTKYPASNKSRTTNLKLAADKVNGTVVLPGQTFSYNSVVGERTIAAGYKEAAVYQDGQVVQGLGGGICQISTTLYNAALYANLEIVERRNHQFVPSYVDAGRDATVVYGSQDFKFKNNRNYAIKIVCSVEGGIARFDIYGLEEENEYEVVISSSITSRNANSFTSATYKTLKQNGQVIATETVSRDTYKSH